MANPSLHCERSFDRRRRAKGEDGEAGDAQGWLARNGTLSVEKGALRVAPAGKGKRAPFIACARLKIAGPIDATIEIRAPRGGKVGLSWRLDDQTDFVAGQTSSTKLSATEKWQTAKVKLPADGRVIHLRAHLPAGVSEIRRIRLVDARGKIAKV
jgi:hypothetical protein